MRTFSRREQPLLLVGLLFVVIGLGSGLLYLLQQPQVSEEAMRAATEAFEGYRAEHPDDEISAWAVVDYSKPSYARRMVIIDQATGLHRFYRVAHGVNSGTLYAREFSNVTGSNTSSIGLFRTGAMYDGDHGRAIRLYGLDSLFNSNAFIRDIVLHSSWYVSIPTILENLFTFNGPRIGRSNGCFVVSPSVIDEIAETLKEHALLYAYGHTNEP